MYKIMAVLAVSTFMATSAFAAGGINSAVGGQSENPQTAHADGSSKAAGSDYIRLHHRHDHLVDKQ